MMGLGFFDLAFYGLALVVAGSSVIVAFSRNLVYSAFALLGSLAGVAGLFALLGADFLAVTQVLIYIGGILVLILFAIMLTSTIRDVRIANRSIGRPAALLASGVTFLLLVGLAWRAPWLRAAAVSFRPTTKAIGNGLLSKYVLPFEVVSVLLLIAVIGAVGIARKEGRPQS
jgi:NAD(P)H-quinone oxidoreductase subunit 6